MAGCFELLSEQENYRLKFKKRTEGAYAVTVSVICSRHLPRAALHFEIRYIRLIVIDVVTESLVSHWLK